MMQNFLQAQVRQAVTPQLCQLLQMHVHQKVLLILDNADDIIGKQVTFCYTDPLSNMIPSSKHAKTSLFLRNTLTLHGTT